MRVLLAVPGFLLLQACGGQAPRTADFKLEKVPPTPKDVIAAVLAHSHLPLSDSTCKSAGTELTDATIGRYLAGFLSELSSQEARNAITTAVVQRDGSYVCRMMIRHAQGEDIWSWGVEFTAGADGLVRSSTFKCLGAG